MVKYAMQNSKSIDEVQQKLAELGRPIGRRMMDLVYLRERPQKRDVRLFQILLFLKSTFWRSLFGKEANELERDGLVENTFYMIERKPLVNKFTRYTYEGTELERKNVPLNLAAFNCGIIGAALTAAGFPCQVSVTWHKGSTYVIKFDNCVIQRERQMESR
ncbi:hypothetical protein AAHC03_026409 [Spirometra sp. Aus1]